MDLAPAFVRQMRTLLPTESDNFFSSLQEELPVSVRLNTAKFSDEAAFKACLPAKLVGSVPWCSGAFYLDHRPSFTFDPLFHGGIYYVQEASSMFTAQAIKQALNCMAKPTQAVRMLDLCAAPGGKSSLAVSLLPEGSLLVANEIIPSRAKVLDENLIKWGTASVVVTQSDPAAFSSLEAAFDLILTDMPCSGEGMFRKEAEAIEAWSEENVRFCAARQRNILTQCWNSLRPGGCLIYSTCTYNTQENEENIVWAAEHLGARILPIECSLDWNIHPAIGHDFPAYRFFPHRTKGEGFFLALLQKEDSELVATSGSAETSEFSATSGEQGFIKAEFSYCSQSKKGFGKKTTKKSPITYTAEKIDKNLHAVLLSLLNKPEAYEISSISPGFFGAFPKEHLVFLSRMRASLKVLRAGLIMGEYKAGQFVPDISLALFKDLEATKHYPVYSLNLRQALSYLRRESLNLEEDCPKGQVLMNYCGANLGWVKNIGFRANNRYPQSWRIRSELPANIT